MAKPRKLQNDVARIYGELIDLGKLSLTEAAALLNVPKNTLHDSIKRAKREAASPEDKTA